MFLFLGSLLWVCFLFFFVDDDSDPLLFPHLLCFCVACCCRRSCVWKTPPAKKNCNKTTYIFYIFVFSVQKMLMMQPAAGSIIQLDG